MQGKPSVRDKYLQERYGITEVVYGSMSRLFHGRCWICQRIPKNNRNLNVDHDHATGQVRGLLCYLCNKKLIGRNKRGQAMKFYAAYLYLLSERDWRS